jgi:3-methyl-2-oxobutanoate hydroxymethyltransferase
MINPVRTTDFKNKKRRGEKIAMLTAYDANMARLLDRAGIDAILVGDSLGMVVLGYPTTVQVTMDAIVHHTAAVSRGTSHALVVGDMPFLSYQIETADALRNAKRLLQEGGAAAVKLEGGKPVIDVVKRLVDIGVPVMGHLGLLPQSVHQAGGFVRQATTPRDADELLVDAVALEEAGAFSVVLEAIPSAVAAAVTRELSIPTIGIGAGPDCDGQVLVSSDMLGLFDGSIPSFVKQYAHLKDTVVSATQAYIDDVRSGRYARRSPAPDREGTPTT